jgi:hypothetical protein
MATKAEVLDVVLLMKRLPNSPVTDKQSLDETVALFLAVLGDLPVDMVKAATIQYCSEGNPFFPTPGVLRDKAMELQLLALGIPSPAEAWGMVLTAYKYFEMRLCDEGHRTREAAANAKGEEYNRALRDYSMHMDRCESCDLGGYREAYDHPAVAETVKLLGGRDVILTDNPVADRARFIEAYREVIARERMKMAMTPKVAEFVENNRPLLPGTGVQIKQLSEGMKR